MFPVSPYPIRPGYYYDPETGQEQPIPEGGIPNYDDSNYPDFFTPPLAFGDEEGTGEQICGKGKGKGGKGAGNQPLPGSTEPIEVPPNEVPERVVNTTGNFEEMSMVGDAYQSAVIPELYGFTGPADDPELTKKLISFVEAMYASDPDFKEVIDGLIDEHGFVSVTPADLEDNVIGRATIGGNEVIIDSEYLANNDLEEVKKVIAHEFGHSTGLEHGDELDALIEKTTDEVETPT